MQNQSVSQQAVERAVEQAVDEAVTTALAQAQAVPAPPAPPPPADLTPDPRLVLEAKEAQREVLGEQLSRLLRRRGDVSDQMNSPETSASERAALEQHYVALNGRIISMEQQIERADAEWAAAAAVPGSQERDPIVRIDRDGPPEAMFILGAIGLSLAMVIMAIAWARRIIKGGGKVVAQIPAAFEGRFTRLEQSLDAVAIEVERISEGQRFLTRVFADQNPRAVGAGEAEAVRRG